jgi:hypothetical protein
MLHATSKKADATNKKTNPTFCQVGNPNSQANIPAILQGG